MTAAFYIAAVIALLATVMVITRLNAVHALLYLVVSLLAVAVCFYALGAPFAAALEAIIYAGAIMVLFVFVVMMLNLGEATVQQEKQWLKPHVWVGPGLLAFILLGELVAAFGMNALHDTTVVTVDSRMVGVALYGPYLVAVELASMLLLAALVTANHLGRQKEEE